MSVASLQSAVLLEIIERSDEAELKLYEDALFKRRNILRFEQLQIVCAASVAEFRNKPCLAQFATVLDTFHLHNAHNGAYFYFVETVSSVKYRIMFTQVRYHNAAAAHHSYGTEVTIQRFIDVENAVQHSPTLVVNPTRCVCSGDTRQFMFPVEVIDFAYALVEAQAEGIISRNRRNLM